MKFNISREELEELFINQNFGSEEIADMYGVSKSVIVRLARSYNLKKTPDQLKQCIERVKLNKGLIADIPDDELRDLYLIQNLGSEEIAVKYGMTKKTVLGIIKKHNLSKDKETIKQNIRDVRIKKGQKFLLPITVEELKEIYLNKNWSYQTIADYLNVNVNLVRKAIRENNIHKSYEDIRQSMVMSSDNVSDLAKEILYDKEKFINFLQDHKDKSIEGISKLIGCANHTVAVMIKKYEAYGILSDNGWQGEREISALLTNLGIKSDKDRKILAPNEIDAYCPDYHIGIEFNGIYWHSDIFKDKQYHFNKSKQCEDQGIRLIHIYEHEWNDPRMRPILESLLKIAFGKVENRIYARNCEIREITNAEAKPFNNANHLQGHRNAQVTYGLFYHDELVQLMSFSYDKKHQWWEIIRGCPGSNNVVVGGVSRLFKHFIKMYNPEKIFSYCDYNKFDGRGYEAIGMKFIGFTGPNMSWLLPGGKVVARQPAKHKELSQIAKAKIWGAGSKKYLWINPNFEIENN